MSIKSATFKSHNKTVEVSRVGKVITQHMDKGASVTYEYPTVRAAKFAMEQARISGNLLSPQ